MPHFRGGLLCWRGGQLPPSRRWSRSPPSWHQKVCGVHPGSAAHVQEDFFFPKEDEIGLVLREHGSCSFSSFPCSFHLGVGNLCCTGVGKSICPQTVDRNKCFFFCFSKNRLVWFVWESRVFDGTEGGRHVSRSNRRWWSRWGRVPSIFSPLFHF